MSLKRGSAMCRNALRGASVAVVLMLSAGCGEANRFADGWDRGGTLHDASMREWAFAVDANRLATSADFVRERIPDMPEEGLPISSALVEKCLSDMSLRSAVDYLKAHEKLDYCFDYTERMLGRLAQEYASQASASE
ncbi:hypothetical protein ACNFCJ_08305 [Pseudomonas sp. NY15364]|uniref:hypothetical protein n=1 Tax=Pseudomonas sp. NY15364 TaxID=3400353 RepID=UPI003A884E3E